MAGKVVGGRYELIERVSSGGMGVVWRGYDTVLDREIAVKVIRPDMVPDPGATSGLVERFRREARITARIRHHGVPQVYDAVLDAGSADQLYLVMEYIEGMSLRAFVSVDEPLPVGVAAATVAQIATVLSHAHAVPVVHRDLKPENVLVAADGTVKVVDFGIAAILRSDITRITSTGSPVGTSRYMAPEQVNAARVTPQSDLYALGCVLHELLAGAPVFPGPGQFQLWNQHLNAAPMPLRRIRADVPEAMEQLVLDLLAKRPEQRPADAYAVYERLLPFLPPPGTAAVPFGRTVGAPDPTLLYRRPNAPLPRTPERVEPTAPMTVVDAPAISSTRLHEELAELDARVEELLAVERFAQAADAVAGVLGRAASAWGKENPRVLALRFDRALILYLGGDSRAARPVFDALAEVYARTAGPTDERTLRARWYAATCHGDLGDAGAALDGFRALLHDVITVQGDAGEMALDVRHSIGMLLLAGGEHKEAEAMFAELHQDHLIINGRDDERTREAAALLARIRFNNP